MTFPKILLFLSIASNLTAYGIYLNSLFRNSIKPHAITFLVWSLILGVNFVIQISNGVGLSSILLGTNFLGCTIIFLYCCIKGYINYDSFDWLCLALAILTIIIWMVTKNPLYSVILSCVIDFLAIVPSFRKSFYKPGEDSALTFFISGVEYLLSFPSYGTLSLIVVLYPACVIGVDFFYASFIWVRRMQLKKLTS